MNKSIKITKGADLKKWLSTIAKASLKEALDVSDEEKAYQRSLEKRIKDTTPPAKNATAKNEDDDPVFADKPSSEEVGGEESDVESVTSDIIIDKLNTIRSGKSLKDADVHSQMDKFVHDLDNEEKIALYSFLKSISQIIAADVPASSVKEPEDEPYNVKMKRVKGLESRREEASAEKARKEKELDKHVRKSRLKDNEKNSVSLKKQKNKGEDRTPPIKVS